MRIIRPEYIYIRLTPNNAIRNNATHKLARTIASLYKNVTELVRREGTQWTLERPSKVAYYVYIGQRQVAFYFIIPRHAASLLREKMSDVWTNITIDEVDALPAFNASATKYALEYEKEDALSLAADRRNSDLLQSTLNVIDVLKEGDKIGVFYNFMPTTQFTWRARYRSTLDRVKQRQPVERNKTGAAYLFKASVSLMNGLSTAVSEVLAPPRRKRSEGVLDAVLERLNGGTRISESTQRKAAATIVNTQIIVLSESLDVLRQRNNARSVTQAFDTLRDDNALIERPLRRTIDFNAYKLPAPVNAIGDEEAQSFIALAGRDILERYPTIERIQTQETLVPDELRKGVMCIGSNVYRGNAQDAYLTTDRDFQNLMLLILGPTRSGKTTLISNLCKDAIDAGECVIIFDFIEQCKLSDAVEAAVGRNKTLKIDCSDPKRIQGLGYNEVGVSNDVFEAYDNAKKQTAQLMTLLDAINTEDTRLTARMERYLTSAALVVFIVGGAIKDIFSVLQDHKARHAFIRRVPDAQHDNLREYLDYLGELDEYKDVKTKEGVEHILVGTHDHLVNGVIDRLNKLKANTYMELMLKRSIDGNIDLAQEMQRNQAICIRMPSDMFSTDSERDAYTTYWSTKIWLALQMRPKRYKTQLRKVNMIIDELYQVENTERFVRSKLSQYAKFALKPIISAHHINQMRHIREELRSANTSYMLLAGCDKKNYAELASELAPFTEEDLLKLPTRHSLNIVKTSDGYARFITKLPPLLR